MLRFTHGVLCFVLFCSISLAVPMDLFEDGRVDIADLSVFTNHWLYDCQTADCGGIDFDSDGVVDLADFVRFGVYWLESDATESSLFGWWEFESIQNQNVISDSSIYKHNAAVSGIALTSDCKVGDYALQMGSNAVCSVSSIGKLNEFTFAGWIKFNSLGSGEYNSVLMNQLWSVSGATRLYITALGQVKLYIYDAGSITSNFRLTAGVWYHIAVTYSNSTGLKGGRSQIYINGNLDKELDLPLSPQKVRFDDTINLGSWQGTQYFFYGIIDDARLYNDVLSFEQINGIAQVYGGYAINNPEPINSSTGISADTMLTWDSPADVVNPSYICYIGTNSTEVSSATMELHPNVYIFDCDNRQYANPFDQLNLGYNVTYYWRVDVVDSNLAVLNKGQVWNFKTVTAEAGLLGYWKLDSYRGLLTKDSSTKASNGIFSISPNIIAGVYDNGLQLSGANSSISISNESFYDVSGQITLTAWIKPQASAVSEQCIISKGDSYGLYFESGTGKIKFKNSGLTVNTLSSHTSVSDGVWHHIAGIYDGTKIVIIIDGIVDAIAVSTGSMALNNTALCIGARADSANYSYSGGIDDIAIRNVVLSEDALAILSDSINEVNLPVIGDAVISSMYTQSNDGTSENITIVAPSPWLTRGLLKFDFGSVPSGKKVISSHLWLYQNSATYTERDSAEISLELCDAFWKEDSVTWDSYYLTANPHVASFNAKVINNDIGWRSWEIGYNNTVNPKFSNYGVLLTPKDKWHNEPSFNSRENSGGNDPYMQVCLVDSGSFVFESVADSTIRQHYPGDVSPAATSTSLVLVTDVASGWAQRPVVKFDLSGTAIEIDNITGAELVFYVVPSEAGTIEYSIHEINMDWQESNATWNLLSSAYNLSAIGYGYFSDDANHYVRVKIDPAVVKGWIRNPSSNYGITIRSTAPWGSPYISIKSRESLCAPMLVVNVDSSIGVSRPAAGQSFVSGTNCTIEWKTKGYADINNVILEYSTDDGMSWETIATTENSGSYIWVVPSENSSKCRIRAKSANNSNIFTVTEPFSIYEPLIYVDPRIKGADAEAEVTGSRVYHLDPASRSWLSSDQVSELVDGVNITKCSVSFWFNLKAGLPSYAIELLAGRDFSNLTSLTINVDPTGKLTANHTYNGYWRLPISTGTGSIASGTWYHVVYSFGPAGQKLFINGVLINANPNEIMPLSELYILDFMPKTPYAVCYSQVSIYADETFSLGALTPPSADSLIENKIAKLFDILVNYNARIQQVSQFEQTSGMALTYERANLKVLNYFASELLFWAIGDELVPPDVPTLSAVQRQDVQWLADAITQWDAHYNAIAGGTIQPLAAKIIEPQTNTISVSEGTFVQENSPIFVIGTWYANYDLLDGLGFNLLGGMIGPEGCVPSETGQPNNGDGILQRDRANVAYEHGYLWDVLLSCESPDWLKQTYPELAVGYDAMLSYDAITRSRQGWWVNQVTLETCLPIIAESPGFFTFDLMNEPGFNGNTVGCQSQWQSWLQTRFSNISLLNAAWGTSYGSWSQIEVPWFVFSGTVWGPPAQAFPSGESDLRKYVDWSRFNCWRVTDFYAGLDSISNIKAPNVYTYIKMLPGPATGIHSGIDVIGNVRATDLAGSDGWWLYQGTSSVEYAVNWKVLMYYDLLHSSRPEVPIVNAETHFFDGGDYFLMADSALEASPGHWIKPIPANHFHSGLWQEAVHGVGMYMIWQNWAKNNMDQRAVAIDAGSKAALDLNRLSSIVKAFQRMERNVGILYSDSSTLWDTDGSWTENAHWDGMFDVYRSLVLNGVPVKFVLERDLANGIAPDVDVLIAANVPNNEPAAISSLNKAISNGLKIWTFTTEGSLQKDSYNRNHTIGVPSSALIIDKPTFMVNPVGVMRGYLADANLLPDIYLVADDKTSDKVEYSVIEYNGKTIINLCNYGTNVVTVELCNKDGRILSAEANDLISGEKINTRGFTVDVEQVRLLELDAAVSDFTVIAADDFAGAAGSVPDLNSWVCSAGTRLDGAGNVRFDTAIGLQTLRGCFEGIYSQAYAPAANQDYGRVEFENIGGAICWNMVIGLTGDSSRILLRTDIGDGMWNIDINGQGYFQTDVSRNAGWGTWVIEWFSDRVRVWHRGSLKYDSQINQPTVEIPTAVMRPDFSGYGGQIMTLGGIRWEVIQLN